MGDSDRRRDRHGDGAGGPFAAERVSVAVDDVRRRGCGVVGSQRDVSWYETSVSGAKDEVLHSGQAPAKPCLEMNARFAIQNLS